MKSHFFILSLSLEDTKNPHSKCANCHHVFESSLHSPIIMFPNNQLSPHHCYAIRGPRSFPWSLPSKVLVTFSFYLQVYLPLSFSRRQVPNHNHFILLCNMVFHLRCMYFPIAYTIVWLPATFGSLLVLVLFYLGQWSLHSSKVFLLCTCALILIIREVTAAALLFCTQSLYGKMRQLEEPFFYHSNPLLSNICFG